MWPRRIIAEHQHWSEVQNIDAHGTHLVVSHSVDEQILVFSLRLLSSCLCSAPARQAILRFALPPDLVLSLLQRCRLPRLAVFRCLSRHFPRVHLALRTLARGRVCTLLEKALEHILALTR
jgi:hypothetical protein